MNLLFRMLREAARASSGFITLLYERFVVLPHNVKQALLLLVDLVSIPVALFIATTLRYGTLQVEIGSSELLVCAATVLVSAVVFLRLGLYRAIVRFMGHEAIVAIVKGVTRGLGQKLRGEIAPGIPLEIRPADLYALIVRAALQGYSASAIKRELERTAH